LNYRDIFRKAGRGPQEGEICWLARTGPDQNWAPHEPQLCRACLSRCRQCRSAYSRDGGCGKTI